MRWPPSIDGRCLVSSNDTGVSFHNKQPERMGCSRSLPSLPDTSPLLLSAFGEIVKLLQLVFEDSLYAYRRTFFAFLLLRF